MCRMRREKEESVSHLTSECSKLAQRDYKRPHDNVAWYMHWQLCGKAELERAHKWYNHTPGRVVESEGLKGLWDFNVQFDRMVKARKPEIIFFDKQAKEAKIIDIAIPHRRCMNKRQRAGENREVPTSSRSIRKDVEAEESDGCANCNQSIRSCIRHVLEIYEKA